MRQWPVQDAKARFSELLKASLTEGPQVVTLRGGEAAVLVPIKEWRHVRQHAQPTLKSLLLSKTPRGGLKIPARGGLRSRPPVDLS